MANVSKMYTIEEVGRILKHSELANGHAEARHSMGGSGRKRREIAETGLDARNLEEASAYKPGVQIGATHACLNSPDGQKGLQALDDGAQRVVIRVSYNVVGYTARMRVSYGENFDVCGMFYGGGGNLGHEDVDASHGVLVCEKREGTLHIVTSYPTRQPPGTLHANASEFNVRWT
ncbi:hypothetical protein BVV20_11760 [Xanthomonas oryzae pv. oryzae]|uniref:hypothetical protein n=1 Tax=Xanthomonas oryzae TaxID=347 RepID=UPI000C7BE8D2|nr:hypothetical protein [Xanthomonas oryzae]AUJ12728.1 hypothetical protein BVV20_11760 [Xanthomonas oryzae pv. oryzae]